MTVDKDTGAEERGAVDSELAQCISEFRFAERLFDWVSDIVFFVKDKNARYVLANETLVGRAGLKSKNEIYGKTVREVFDEPFGSWFSDQDSFVLKTGGRIEGQIELHLYADESRGWCLTHKIPLFHPEGSIVGLAGISKDLHEPGQERSEFGLVAEAAAEIAKNFGEPIRVSELAKSSQLTLSRFERIIQRIFGMTPVQLLAKTRLDAAVRLLENTEESISQIAHTCGYTDHSAFSRQFRRSIGLTPSEYRSRHK